jgi:hypothetical protein
MMILSVLITYFSRFIENTSKLRNSLSPMWHQFLIDQLCSYDQRRCSNLKFGKKIQGFGVIYYKNKQILQLRKKVALEL